jgi:hypothetical protein
VSDLARLPTGAAGWSQLVDHALSLGDLSEVNYLELKSTLPFGTRPDRKRAGALLARQILGFAQHRHRRQGHRWTSCLRLVMLRSGVRFSKAARRLPCQTPDLSSITTVRGSAAPLRYHSAGRAWFDRSATPSRSSSKGSRIDIERHRCPGMPSRRCTAVTLAQRRSSTARRATAPRAAI